MPPVTANYNPPPRKGGKIEGHGGGGTTTPFELAPAGYGTS